MVAHGDSVVAWQANAVPNSSSDGGSRLRAVRRQTWLGVAAMAALVMSACTGTPAGSPPGADPSGEADGTQTASTPPTETNGAATELPPPEIADIELGLTTLGADGTPYMIAVAAGLFENHGLNVELVVFDSPRRGLQAVIAEQVEATTLSASLTLTSMTTDVPLQDVAIMQNVSLDCIFAESSITSGDDIAGKRYGINQLGDGAHGVAVVSLANYGLTSDDVELVEIGAQGDRVAALRAGSVDLIMADCVLADELEPDGIQPLLDMSTDVEIDLPSTPTSLRRDFIEENPNTVLALTAGLLEGMAMLQTDEGTELAVQELTEMAQIDEESARVQVEAFKAVAQYNLRSSPEGYETIQEVTATANPDVADVDVSTAFDYSFLDQLAELGFYEELGIEP